MALVICLHPESSVKAISCGMSPDNDDTFVLLEDAVLTHGNEVAASIGQHDAKERGIVIDLPQIGDDELIDLIFDHKFTFIC